MGRRKTPQQKKAESYARDRVYFGWHGRRAPSPALQKRYRHAEHAYRHGINAKLKLETAVPDRLDTEEKLALKRLTVRHRTPQTLEDFVVERRWESPRRQDKQFLTKPYNAQRDRKPFLRYLTARTGGRYGTARTRAKRFARLLAPASPNKPTSLSDHEDAQRRWLVAFFADEPEWEARLRAWIAELLPDEPER